KEKGTYPVFAGSDWHTGAYFRERGYNSPAWLDLAAQVAVNGLRNGWLLAVAPNMSTAQIAGSTASIDPIYSAFYYEEKKDYRRPVAAPGLSLETWPYYEKGAWKLDQFASVRQNARRQRHIDQSISFNFYVPSTIRASTLLDLHMTAWREGLKTTYYVRSNDIDIAECEWCSSCRADPLPPPCGGGRPEGPDGGPLFAPAARAPTPALPRTRGREHEPTSRTGHHVCHRTADRHAPHRHAARTHPYPGAAPSQPIHRDHQRPHLRHPQLERYPLPVVLPRLQGALDQLLDPGRGRHEGRRAPVRRVVGAREERLRFDHRPAGHAGFAADALHLQRRRVHHRPGRARQCGDHRPAGGDPQRELQLRAGLDHRPGQPEADLRDRPHPPHDPQAQRTDHGLLRRLHAREDRRDPAARADPVLDPGGHQLLFRLRLFLQPGAPEPDGRHWQDHQLHQPRRAGPHQVHKRGDPRHRRRERGAADRRADRVRAPRLRARGGAGGAVDRRGARRHRR